MSREQYIRQRLGRVPPGSDLYVPRVGDIEAMQALLSANAIALSVLLLVGVFVMFM